MRAWAILNVSDIAYSKLRGVPHDLDGPRSPALMGLLLFGTDNGQGQGRVISIRHGPEDTVRAKRHKSNSFHGYSSSVIVSASPPGLLPVRVIPFPALE